MPADRRIVSSDWYQAMYLRPEPDNPRATVDVDALDENGRPVTIPVVTERPLTIYINSREIITQMTIGMYPRWLALGYLSNQRLLTGDDRITAIDYDQELEVVVVRTASATAPEPERLSRITRTSGCAQGTMFGNLIEDIGKIRLSCGTRISREQIICLLQRVQLMPSVYLKAGAIHGCTLARDDTPLLTVEDIGRHNAVDTIAGYVRQQGLATADKIMYTTGRLTSEMVLKTIQLGIPILISRSGYTAPAVTLARQCRLTLIGRARGKRLQVLAAPQRLRWPAGLEITAENQPIQQIEKTV